MQLNLRNGPDWMSYIGAGGMTLSDFFSDAQNSLDGLWGVIGFFIVVFVGQAIKWARHKHEIRKSQDRHKYELMVQEEKAKQEAIRTKIEQLKLERLQESSA